MSTKVTKLEVRTDAKLLAEFERNVREWRADQWTMEGADLAYIQHMSAGLRAAASIDLCWLFDHTAAILGDNAPLELIFNRHKDNFLEVSQVLAFISWKHMMEKHKTLSKP